ncbi:terminase small subunit [Roseomonas terrae]|uniref:Terminase small subunit n=2 Tax=Neoroseomonas terrae TaxID=424799 RepID=A0ABS5EPV7_9PROT|nr:terminase small subunit [Neoroseomonas terrae]
MVTVNLEEMADKLRISLPTLRRMMRRYPEFPVVAEGSNGVPWQLDPAAVITFVQAKRDEDAAARDQRDDLLSQVSLPMEDLLPEAERILSAGERLKLAQAMRVEDDVAKQRGFLVLTSEMRIRLAEAWTPLSQFLAGLPSQLGRRHNLPDAVVRDMRRAIEAQQRELHRKLNDLLSDDAAPPPEEQEHAGAA